jgi:cysteine synthase B
MQPDSPMHGLEGWKHLETAKVPGIHDFKLADESIEVNSNDALRMIKTVQERYDLRISPSAAASLVGAKQLAEQNENSFVLTTLADDGTKYQEVYDDLGLTLVEELD